MMTPRPFPGRLVPLLALLVSAACGPAKSSPLEIRLVVPAEHPEQAMLAVAVIPSHYLPSRSDVSAEQWPAILRVTVARDGEVPGLADADLPPVAGSYSLTGDGISFTPMFGFDPGLRYRAVFDGSRLPTNGAWSPEPVVAIVGLPKKDLAPTTVVDRVYPTADVVPENLLRVYVHFSAPMGRKGGLEYVRLLDSAGRDVKDPFLPLDADFWNADRTRFTLFFDPGRVKRGILPNEQMGRPLIAGRQYTLVVDREWRDGNGVALKESFRKTFRAGPADMRPIDPASWHMNAPAAGSRDPLVATFPEPLDHGLLMRALGVADARGNPVRGDVRVDAQETQWAFTPNEPWGGGDYRLAALTILEDLAGNRIGRAFEVDQFEKIDQQADQERITLPFHVQKR